MHDGAGLRVPDDGTPGHLDIQGLPVLAVAALALAVGAVARHVFAFIPKVHQRGHIIIHSENHVAAATAVAPVRAAGRHVLLSVEGHRPIPALAGVDADAGLIDKR